MPPRKRISHAKSRRGCSNCKRKHVKCDEQGPPCANCIARSFADSCRYTDPSPPTSGSSSTPAAHDVVISDMPFQLAATLIPDYNLSETDRLLELELLHRWTSQTYKSFVSIPEESQHIQIHVTRTGLANDYLLRGLLATAALETSLTSDPVTARKYSRIAVEYYTSASRTFRAQLANLSTDNQYCTYLFSSIVILCEMYLPQLHRGVLQRPYPTLDSIATVFEASMGSLAIAKLDFEHFMQSPIGESVNTLNAMMLDIGSYSLDEDTETALARLALIFTSQHTLPPIYTAMHEGIRLCYVGEAKGISLGFCLCYPAMADRAFVQSIKDRDPIALFLLLHWGVLLDRLGYLAWWATAVGRNLVIEISAILWDVDIPVARMPEWSDSIAWARGKVLADVTESLTAGMVAQLAIAA